MAKKQKNELFSSILYIAIGVLLAVFKGAVLNWIMTAIGILFIVSGVLDIIKKNYTGGVVSLVIGTAIIVLGWFAVTIVLIALGVLIAVKGIIALIGVLKKNNPNALEILFPILSILLGIGLAFGNLSGWIIFFAGILLAIDGALGLWGALKK